MNGLSEKKDIGRQQGANGSVIFEIHQPRHSMNWESDSLGSDTLSWILYYLPENRTDTLHICVEPYLGSYIKYNSQIIFDSDNPSFQHLTNSSVFNVTYSQ